VEAYFETTLKAKQAMKLSRTIKLAINAPFIFLLRVYQYGISPILGPRCRFEPSCSQYALEALKTYALPKALFLSAKRILRCHPWHPGGYDPLPEEHKH
jgi:putative membrane protein insertion efficiency factor